MTANNTHYVNDPQTSPGAQLDLTNHTVFRGLERKESIWENMGLNLGYRIPEQGICLKNHVVH